MARPGWKRPVSIVILAYNRWDVTEKCFAAIRENTTEYQVVVVDNASSDETPERLRELEGEWEELRVVHNTRNVGFAAGCNQGVGIAKHGTICLLNNDTEPQPGWLDAMLSVFDKGVGAVGAKLLYPDGTIQHAGIIFRYSEQPFPHFAPDHRFLRAPADLPEANICEVVPGCTAACLLTNKTVWQRVGGMDEGYLVANFEDVDFNLKVRDSGLKIVYQPEAVVIHHEHATMDDMAKRAEDPREHFHRNMARLIERWNDKLLAGMYRP